MKQTALFIFLVFAITHGKSQENFPLPSDNPFWTESHAQLWACTYSNDCGGYYCECTTPVYYKTDTVMNGKVYNRLYSRGVCKAIYAGGPPPYGCPFVFNYTNAESLYAIIRQDTVNKTVYLWDNIKDTLLYDFKNMIVGMPYPLTVSNLMQNTLIVVSEDSVLLRNKYVKKWNLGFKQDEIIYDSGSIFIIEGIGSSYGILANLVPPFENSDELLCFSRNNEVIYPDNTFDCDKTVRIIEYSENPSFNLYPNPATEQITIEIDYIFKNSGLIKIYNAAGFELLHYQTINSKTTIDLKGMPEGIYFVQLVNGNYIETKKFIKK